MPPVLNPLLILPLPSSCQTHLVVGRLLAVGALGLSVAEAVLIEDPAEGPLDGVEQHVPDGGPDPGDDDVSTAEGEGKSEGGG